MKYKIYIRIGDEKNMNEDEMEEYEGKIILVTGGAGCIGTNLCRKLAELNAGKVIILDDLSSAYEWNIPKAKNITFVKGSILDDGMLKRVFKERPDYVFHLAAHFANQNCINHPETDPAVNGLGLLKMLEYSRLMDLRRFFFAGSGCSVYGSPAKLPFAKGTVSLTPDTPYQIDKIPGEIYCNHYHETYGLLTTIGRFFNVFGLGGFRGNTET